MGNDGTMRPGAPALRLLATKPTSYRAKRRIETLATRPRPIMMVMTEEPPWLTSGNVTPTTGARPVTMPMFTNTCQKIIAATPQQIVAPKRSRACDATFMIQSTRNR